MSSRAVFASLLVAVATLTAMAPGCGQDFSAAPDGEGGSAPACETASDCPGIDGECGQRTCSNARCAMSAEPEGTSCQQTWVCDGKGNCVECVESGSCPDGAICLEHSCVPESCGNGTLDGDETAVDCGGSCPGCDNGQACDEGDDCQSGYCDPGGTCAACASNEHCGDSTYCKDGSCTAKNPNGSTCADGASCLSGICAADDGVCCDAACEETCVACLQGKTGQVNGQCAPVLEATDPDGECAAEAASTCGSSGAGCRGDGPACILHPVGTTCGATSCVDDDAVTQACDGAGSCLQNIQDCGAYTCEAGHCNTSCSEPGDCTIACNPQTNQCVSCGTELVPTFVCPIECTGGCGNNVCNFACGGTNCAGTTITCPPAMPCTVKCEGQSACEGTTVVCNPLYGCKVDCTTTASATCRGLNLACGSGGVCSLACGSGDQSCKEAEVTCGSNSCTATCTSIFDPPTVSCGEACSCQHASCY